MDGSDLIKREGESTAGRLQWPDGGAMAEKADTSPEFTIWRFRPSFDKRKVQGGRVGHGELT
jgi:hypothetical protein